MKTLLVILDGAAESCTTQSAYARAKKPHLDMLASNSTCGLWSGPYTPDGLKQRLYPIFNRRSLSSFATLEILGYSFRDEPGRGYLEALGTGLKPRKDSVCVRGNFAFVKGTKIIDRRAGRDEKGLDIFVKEINKIKPIDGIKIRLYRLVGHRVVLILTGRGLCRHVSDADVGKKLRKIKPLEAKAKKTAQALNKFVEESSKILSHHPMNRKRKFPANFILLRSAGSFQKVTPFKKKYGLKACSVSGVNIIRGISKYVGIDIIEVPLSQIENDLNHRAKMAIDALEKYDFVILHINGADTYAHNKDFKGKVDYIEKIDKEVFSHLVRLRNINIAVISDHITDSRSGEHLLGPMPLLIYAPEENGEYEVINFNEKSCKGFVVDNPMKKIMSVM